MVGSSTTVGTLLSSFLASSGERKRASPIDYRPVGAFYVARRAIGQAKKHEGFALTSLAADHEPIMIHKRDVVAMQNIARKRER